LSKGESWINWESKWALLSKRTGFFGSSPIPSLHEIIQKLSSSFCRVQIFENRSTDDKDNRHVFNSFQQRENLAELTLDGYFATKWTGIILYTIYNMKY
jgi:hypothetical protein